MLDFFLENWFKVGIYYVRNLLKRQRFCYDARTCTPGHDNPASQLQR